LLLLTLLCRHSLDEGAVDITAQVESRLQSGPPAISFSGHVLGLALPGKTQQSGTLFDFESMHLDLKTLPAVDVALLVGSQVVAEMRKALEKETGFLCSCGIAQNVSA
jgi:nucleotidyltransferase/DNA polymerase involved in DNA repair